MFYEQPGSEVGKSMVLRGNKRETKIIKNCYNLYQN